MSDDRPSGRVDIAADGKTVTCNGVPIGVVVSGDDIGQASRPAIVSFEFSDDLCVMSEQARRGVERALVGNTARFAFDRPRRATSAQAATDPKPIAITPIGSVDVVADQLREFQRRWQELPAQPFVPMDRQRRILSDAADVIRWADERIRSSMGVRFDNRRARRSTDLRWAPWSELRRSFKRPLRVHGAVVAKVAVAMLRPLLPAAHDDSGARPTLYGVSDADLDALREASDTVERSDCPVETAQRIVAAFQAYRRTPPAPDVDPFITAADRAETRPLGACQMTGGWSMYACDDE